MAKPLQGPNDTTKVLNQLPYEFMEIMEYAVLHDNQNYTVLCL